MSNALFGSVDSYGWFSGLYEEIKETFDRLEDAIGEMTDERCRVVGRERTDDLRIQAQGFTTTYYVLDSSSIQWTVFFDPQPGLYACSH